MAIFDPPQNRHPSTDHQNICHRWLSRRPLWLRQIRCISVHGGLLGTWVKYNQNYFYLYLFGNSPTGQTRRRIFTHDGSNDADSRKDVPFLGICHIAPHLGGQTPKKQFWGVNRRFQAQLVKSKNVHIIKTTASIPTKFCIVIKTTKCPSWVVPTHVLQIQDGGWPPSWKNRKIVTSQLLGDAVQPSWPFRPFKIRNFRNPRWQPPPSWKI